VGLGGFHSLTNQTYSDITIIVILSRMQKLILSPKSVLVVDDDIAVCRIVQRMLSNELYTVQTSQSVAGALEVIEQKPFDVYVLDYNLPDGSGLDVAERIRSVRGAAPIILISGYNPGAVALRAAELCISDFLQKPFSRETICNAVKKAADSPSAKSPPLEAAESERSRTKSSFLQEAVLAIKLRFRAPDG
jgi:two-component system, NtrC family, response regulator HydG